MRRVWVRQHVACAGYPVGSSWCGGGERRKGWGEFGFGSMSRLPVIPLAQAGAAAVNAGRDGASLGSVACRVAGYPVGSGWCGGERRKG